MLIKYVSLLNHSQGPNSNFFSFYMTVFSITVPFTATDVSLVSLEAFLLTKTSKNHTKSV